MARLWPDSGHNAIFVASTERDKVRQGFCLASMTEQHLSGVFMADNMA